MCTGGKRAAAHGPLANVISDYAQATLGYRLSPDNAQNWWRQQLADLALIGSAGPMLCSVLALVAVLRSWRRPRDGAAARTAPLVAAGLMAFVNPPTQHPMLQVLLGLVVALAWAVAIACGAGRAVEGWTAFRPPHRAARFHFDYSYGLSAPMQTPLGEGRWSARRAVAVFPPGARCSWRAWCSLTTSSPARR